MNKGCRLPVIVCFVVMVWGALHAENPYKKYYFDATKNWPYNAGTICSFNPSGTKPLILSGTNPQDDFVFMYAAGFMNLGVSLFESTEANEKDAIKFGAELGCVTVISYQKFARTTIETFTKWKYIPPSSSTTTINGNVYGRGGSGGTYSGTATTNTSGTYTTQQVPKSVDRYTFAATYWVPRKVPPVFGVYCTDLTQEEKQNYRLNGGAVVRAVMQKSPASSCGLTRGDILLKIGNDEIANANDWSNIMDKSKGQARCIEYLRGSTTHRGSVVFNNLDGTPGKRELNDTSCEDVNTISDKPQNAMPSTSVEVKTVQQPETPSFGNNKVTFQSTPEGAYIYLDDKLVSCTPATLFLTAGKHKVRLSQYGYSDWTQEIYVNENASMSLVAEMKKR